MTEQYGLPLAAIEKLRAVFKAHPKVKSVLLYGSRAKGNYRTGSDIDLCIENEITLDELLKIDSEIDDLLLPWSVDLSLYQKIENPQLQESIKKTGVLFYSAR